jgi:hypothetical protein
MTSIATGGIGVVVATGRGRIGTEIIPRIAGEGENSINHHQVILVIEGLTTRGLESRGVVEGLTTREPESKGVVEGLTTRELESRGVVEGLTTRELESREVVEGLTTRGLESRVVIEGPAAGVRVARVLAVEVPGE